ncbi:uncharacterized protein AB675_1389 [Cyphellophora attinorum]|uniref:Uncharacterized protein n=1 Tax=Cyphellophora attinorum TaxID=1664694 RepID=A0A0N1NX10_9EURO|nr:uncharacterized protein AB675_1389 [Phialophora attinorum]KPI34430.1 hypothetical protein AB675_1389 [Phialophora attinorum]
MAAMVTQTVAIVDKSNKVVGTTKQLKNVFKEAKLAYMERKAEIVAERKAKEDRELQKARKHVEAMTIADEDERRSIASSAPRHRSRRHAHYESDEEEEEQQRERRRPSMKNHHRQHSSMSVRSGQTASSRSSFDSARPHRTRTRSIPHSPRSPLGQFNDDLAATRSAPGSPTGHALTRRKTDGLALQQSNRRPSAPRSFSDANIDMDLAYGDFHPSSIAPKDLALSRTTEQKLQEQEMKTLVQRAKGLMDEANCAQHSVKAIIAHLQKNPDAMAAVALTLAEISNIATKMAPGALAAMKGSAPAVFALLASPQFLIAVGVGVGVTVVAIGGYKIIKKIQAAKADKEGSMDEMLEVKELDRIEHWRRGIADVGDEAYEASIVSGATSVEGEFITPMAARSMGHLVPEETKKEKKERKKKAKDDEKREKKDKKSNSRSEVRSEVSSKGSEKRRKSRVEDVKGKEIVVKKPSPLRRMFTPKEASSRGSTASGIPGI